jgi:fermentation-respiration switch protein FrsA (DUF1100 family)
VRIPTSAGHVLAGTLTLPTTVNPPFPAVVLATGSGAQNRDHVANERTPFNRYRPFRQIADTLSRRGLAVLRVDDRSVGCSGGGALKDTPLRERANDTRASLDFLRTRKDIDPNPATDPSIKAIAVLAATATPGWDVYVSQQRHLIHNDIFTEEERKRLAAGLDTETILTSRTEQFRKEVVQGKWGSWWQSFMTFNPRNYAGDVSCPVLIVHGDRDTNVPVEHATLLAEAMIEGGNKDVTVKILENHNHLLLEDSDGFFRRYKELLYRTNQLSTSVLALIGDWYVDRMVANANYRLGSTNLISR